MSADVALIMCACLLDAALGDPCYRWHPIRVLARWSQHWEHWLFGKGWNGYAAGIVHWLLVVGGALAAWYLMHRILAAGHPALAWLWDLYIAYSLLCLRDLLAHGQRVLNALPDLPTARQQLSMFVGRDTAPLQVPGIVRATIESLAENLTDGVLTPFWALCLFGLPGLIAVKAISSLDSMIGYKNERYQRFGWAGARSDDVVHWLPARLSVALISLAALLLRFHPLLAWQAARRYHGLLASPNSGWSEAAVAGALRVRLIGPIYHSGQLVTELFMGDTTWPADLDAADLRRALRLILVCGLLAITGGLLLAMLR